MAVEQIIKEIQHLDLKDKARLLRLLEAELIKEDRKEDRMDDFIGSIKKLSKPSKGALGYEERLGVGLSGQTVKQRAHATNRVFTADGMERAQKITASAGSV